ncbi:nuclear transport factor 2 family protein [Chthonobacter albigriseus]|uniref:nuclear transport factor 2 family protein n=1 Tax=Chthonobacter albigriseus TaxID=1683161 RepID=UPI0015EF99EC|nr:nuclear transport factor 2 family protein [Chthonobacter albigriseus]
MTAKKTMIVAVSSLVLFAAGPALANTGSCAPLDEAAAKAAFDKWAAAVPGHNPDMVLDFYAPGHSFKPHDKAEALTDRTAIRDYWNAFVDKTPKVTLGEAKTEMDCNKFVKSGVKTWNLGGEELATNFTMEFENKNGTWLITSHEITPVAN